MANNKKQTSGSGGMTAILRETLAEYLGTTVLLVFGMGSVAQFVLSEGHVGTHDQVRWSWGLGVTFGVYVSGGISGGHLNPAVTLTLCLFNRVPWKKLIPYCLGQYIGAFTASCIVFGVYYDALNAYKDGNRTIETASIFATYPQGYLSIANGLADQIFGTAVLMLVVMALGDPNNMAPSKGIVPLLVGLLVVVIGMTFSLNCGYAINPARDLAPRLFTWAAGWGNQVFSYNNYCYFWIPIVGPHIGAVLGGFIYELCINNSFPFNPCRNMNCESCNCRSDDEHYELQNSPSAKKISSTRVIESATQLYSDGAWPESETGDHNNPVPTNY